MIDSGPSTIAMPLRARPRLQSGLRLQIVLSLAMLMLLAFLPLFFAVASLARATIQGAREQSARVLGRAIAAHVSDARARGDDAVRRALRDQIGPDGVGAICVFSPEGARLACAGSPLDTAAMTSPPAASGQSVRTMRGAAGRALEVASSNGDVFVVTRMHVDTDIDRGTPLVRLVALYMIVFALALLVFAYFALTRLIVRPVDRLVEAADRIASGTRSLQFPRTGTRELADVGASVQAMAGKLISEEAALILKVAELTDTTTRLTQTQAQLVRSERMASVGRLAAGVAHEIGNPITALMGMQELLLEGDLPPDAHRDFLQRMRAETGRIHTVLHDLLDFARPEQPALIGGGAPIPADVSAVVDDVVSLVRPQKAFRRVTIDKQVTGSPMVTLPAPRLTQILLNMVMNAGASVATANRDDGHVTVRARAVEGKRVRIEIEDDGPGIAAGVRDRLFEPFVTTKDVGEGTGLGLAVCRGLVESAGGEIGVDASYRQGARFYVILPSSE